MSEPLLIEDVAAWWAERTGLVVGTDLFVGELPEDAALATVLRGTGGPARGSSPLERLTFQALTRGPSYPDTHARAEALCAALYPPPLRLPVRMTDLPGGRWWMLTIDAIQPPFDLGRSDGGRWQAVFNVQVSAARKPGQE